MKDITKIGHLYKRYVERMVPAYAGLSMISCFLLNSIIYFGTQRLMAGARHYDLSIPLDDKIPFLPEWIYIYVFCYIVWVIGYIVISRQGKEHWYRFALADMSSRIICGVFFIFLPTTIDRPAITEGGLTGGIVNLIFTLDSPTNLFPSIHCLVSWLCFIGVRGKREVSVGYKVYIFIYALLVFISVVTLKQHVMVDIFAGIAIAELCYRMSCVTEFYKKLMKLFDNVNSCILGKDYYE